MVKNDPKIPYSKENIIRCLCPTCPVQEDSLCAKKKLMESRELMQSEEILKGEDYPGMYCTNGKATCEDIDTNKNCICPDCAIHKEYKLDGAKPSFLYCKEGEVITFPK